MQHVSAIHEHRHFVVNRARRLGGGRIDPEDLAQDVLERWVRSAPHIDDPRRWMMVVLRHLVIDRLRRHGPEVILTDGADQVAAETPTAPWWRDLDASVVERELADLPPPLRDAFRMFTFEARSYRQIAHHQNVAVGTVGTRVSRARALLRQRLTEHRVADRTPARRATSPELRAAG